MGTLDEQFGSAFNAGNAYGAGALRTIARRELLEEGQGTAAKSTERDLIKGAIIVTAAKERSLSMGNLWGTTAPRASFEHPRRTAGHMRVAALCLLALAAAPFAHAQTADLSLTMTVSNPTPLVGSQVSFDITVANAGPSNVQRASVRDRLPNGYTYVSHTASKGTYTPSNGAWKGFGVVANGSQLLTIVATVLESGNHNNVALITTSTLPDPDSTPGNGNQNEDDYAKVTTTPVQGNVAPIINGQLPLTTRVDRPILISTDDFDIVDPDTPPEDLVLTVLPQPGYTTDGSLVTPDEGFIGSLQISVEVSDGQAVSPPFEATLTVTGPNFVVVMVDDLDSRSLNDLLGAGLMPNLQAYFIDRGVTFTENYATDPFCCPSRATFFAGQYAHNHGIVNNNLVYSGVGQQRAVGQFNDTNTLPTKLQALGYTTAYFGKYLNGYGIDPSLVWLSPAFDPAYVPPGWTSWNALVDLTTYCVYNFTISHNGNTQRYLRPVGQTEDSATYQTNVLADLAEAYVSDHKDDAAPFFLNMMTLTPHGERCNDAYDGNPPPGGGEDGFGLRIRPAPEDKNTSVPAFVPTPAYDEDLADKPDWLDSVPPLTATDLEDVAEQYTFRLRAMLSVDRMLGRIVNALGDHLDDTVLVFTSDNGWLYGEHRRSGKIYAYRESSLVPFYVAGPGVTPGVRPNLVVNNDILPTLLDMASPGYVDASADGRSIVPILREAQPPGWTERKRVLIEFGRTVDDAGHALWPTYFALQTPTQSYIESYEATWYTPSPSLDGVELYDRIADPHQMNSLLHYPENSPDPTLGPLLNQLKTCAGETCRQFEDAP